MGRARDLLRRFENEGEAIIDEFINEKKSEELFLDFKRSAEAKAPVQSCTGTIARNLE